MSYIEKKPETIFYDRLSVECEDSGRMDVELDNTSLHELFELAFGERLDNDYFEGPHKRPVGVVWMPGALFFTRLDEKE